MLLELQPDLAQQVTRHLFPLFAKCRIYLVVAGAAASGGMGFLDQFTKGISAAFKGLGDIVPRNTLTKA